MSGAATAWLDTDEVHSCLIAGADGRARKMLTVPSRGGRAARLDTDETQMDLIQYGPLPRISGGVT